jgi:protein-disulfide isomerase
MARPTLKGLVADYPQVIQLIFRHFPITTVHPHAFVAAESAEAAGAQGKFWQMHDMLFTHQQFLDIEDLRQYGQEIGLDLKRFDQEMNAHKYEHEVKQDFRRGIEDGVNGTPTIFINGIRYDGPRDRESILAAISVQVSTLG